ncbi:unnamed protein product [Choristocarpus tenellus]
MAETRAPDVGGGSVVAVEVESKEEEKVANEEPGGSSTPLTLTLRLRARPSVTWGEDVINNENMGKKSSKRCCIFHKKRDFGESSSDESDSDMDDEAREKKWAQPNHGKPRAHQVYHA